MNKLVKSLSRFASNVDFGFSTKCVHSGVRIDEYSGAVNVPIQLSSTFAQKTPGQNYPADCMYTRIRNPSRTALETLIADLEGGEHCYVSSSGLGATMNILMLLRKGDHLITIDDLYGGTQELLDELITNLGIEHDYVNMQDEEHFRSFFKDNTKMVWIESPTNPTLEITDIQKMASIAHEYGATVVVDNTFATPYLQNPLDLGCDIVMHSCTKYINGHGDIVMGACVTNDDALSDRLFFNAKSVGASPSPFDCYMAQRGCKTLEIRMERINENAKIVAEFLENHPKVEKVRYPGLKSHPQHELAKEQMKDFGGMITFYLKGDLEESARFLEELKVFVLAVSLGGVESLAEHPALMTHANVSQEQREACNITNNLIRLSIGIENVDDLIWDLEQAFEAV